MNRLMTALVAAKDAWNGEISVCRYELSAVVKRANGEIEDLGVVSRKKITTVFVTELVAVLAGGAIGNLGNYKYHQTGTGSTAEANSDTGLVTAVESRVSGTQTAGNPGGAVRTYATQATITYSSGHTIREHGIFNALTGGSLMDRSVLASAISINAGDEITFVYTLSISAEA